MTSSARFYLNDLDADGVLMTDLLGLSDRRASRRNIRRIDLQALALQLRATLQDFVACGLVVNTECGPSPRKIG
jgi:hypothetical protein